MVKLSDIDLPVTYKRQLLFKHGNWNKLNISKDEVNKSSVNTKWDNFNKSLLYSHRDGEAEAWVGKVDNVHSFDGATYGDVEIWDQDLAIKIKHGKAPFAISAGIAWPEQYDQPKDFIYRNFNVVADPGVKDKDIFMNFFSLGETSKGFRTANFSAMLSEDAQGSTSTEVHSNERIAVGKKKHKCKQCGFESEDEDDDDKKEEEKESKEHPTMNKEEIKQIVEDHEKKKEANMDNNLPRDIEQVKKDITPSDANTKSYVADDVINKKDQTMETQGGSMDDLKPETKEKIKELEEKEEKTADFNANIAERGSIKEKPMEEKNSPVEKKLDSLVAKFEQEMPKESQETKKADLTNVEPKKEETKEVPSVPEKVQHANPVMDEDAYEKIAAKVASKISLTPKSMTVNEFGSQVKDPTEETIERLAKGILKQ